MASALLGAALIACGTQNGGGTPTPVERRVDFSSGQLSAGAEVVQDANANGGDVVALDAQGESVDVTLPDDFVPGTYALDLRARGRNVLGDPDVRLEINGQSYGNVTVNQAAYADLTVNSALASLKPGDHLVVTFVNPLSDSGQSRAVFVDDVNLTPATKPPVETPTGNGYTVDVYRTGLKFPSSINFEPDGNLLILQRGDRKVNESTGEPLFGPDAELPARLWRLNMSSGEMTEITGMPQVKLALGGQETFNGGAVGMALDSDYANNHTLYICYQYQKGSDPNKIDDRRNRLSSFVVNGDTLTNEKPVVDDVPAGGNHNGCRVVEGQDGKLYYSTGDGNSETSTTPYAQDLTSLAGKVLRVNKDGTPPADNPYFGTGGNARFVWSFGHRNPQGLAFRPGTSELWETEHGPQNNDELNFIVKGVNYGWPACNGTAVLGEVRNGKTCQVSVGTYRPAVSGFYDGDQGSTIAPSDLAFYDADAFPQWKGSLFLVTLKTGRLIRYELNGDKIANRETLIAMDNPEDPNYEKNFGRLRDVTVGPDGFIYVSTEVTNPYADPGGNIRPANPAGGLLLRIRPK